MARGNDADDARSDLETRLGVEVNAEKIIKYSEGLWPRELRAASAKRVNEEATEALDESAVAAYFQDTGALVDGAFTVRGGKPDETVIAVVDLGGGRTKKVCAPLAEVDGSAKPAAKPAAKRATKRTARSAS